MRGRGAHMRARAGAPIKRSNRFNRRSSISELLFKSLSDRNPDAMQIAHQRRQSEKNSTLHSQKHVNCLIVVDVLA